jgi:thiol-disulfide isomerase/thioredoxin
MEKMSGILFYGSADFSLRQGENGSLLCLTYDAPGLTLVLFYSNHCEYCENLIKKFKQLPGIFNGCQFSMVNVSQHPDIPERSSNTMAAITYVPDVILYVNGSPYIRYDGPHEIDQITNFIVEIYKKVQQINFFPKQQTQQTQQPQHQPQQQTQQTQQPQQFSRYQQPQQMQPQQPQQPQPQRQQPYQQQQSQNGQQRPAPQAIPAYTTGKPIVGNKNDKVCYLNFNSAYVTV